MFDFPLWVGDFYPHWDAVEVLDSDNVRTLAYDLIQQLVCSAARRIEGEPSHPFVRGACRWRRAGVFMTESSGRWSHDHDAFDVCSTQPY